MQQFLSPYFHSAVKVLNAAEKDGVKPTQKAVVDLETLLTHLQQDTDIPQIELYVEPAITQAVQKVGSLQLVFCPFLFSARSNSSHALLLSSLPSSQAQAQNRAPAPADLGDQANNVEFLKTLERSVAGWIREIQKVTQLDRDPSSGTARQEIR